MTETRHKERYDDIMIAQLIQSFNDFKERYDRDIGAANERARLEKNSYDEWKKSVDTELRDQSKILADIAPIYVRGKWIVALVTMGSVALAVKEFWAHFKWGP